jgi:hypothetical protein
MAFLCSNGASQETLKQLSDRVAALKACRGPPCR